MLSTDVLRLARISVECALLNGENCKTWWFPIAVESALRCQQAMLPFDMPNVFGAGTA